MQLTISKNIMRLLGGNPVEFSFNSMNKTQRNNCFISFACIYFMDKVFITVTHDRGHTLHMLHTLPYIR